MAGRYYLKHMINHKVDNHYKKKAREDAIRKMELEREWNNLNFEQQCLKKHEDEEKLTSFLILSGIVVFILIIIVIINS